MNTNLNESVWFTADDLMARYRVTRTSIYIWTKTQEFPRGIKLGGSLVRWRREDVLAWEAAKVEAQAAE